MSKTKASSKKLSSFQTIIIGFIAVILAGALLLMLPVSKRGEGSASFLDALFTATSATCVTGLITQDTATYWSGFGQAVILTLIQIGGLGCCLCNAVGQKNRTSPEKHYAGFHIGNGSGRNSPPYLLCHKNYNSC